MAKDRPALTSLSDRLARKPSSVEKGALVDEGGVKEAGDRASDVRTEQARTPRKAKTGDGRVQIIVRMSPAERKALRQIALDQDTTVQALAEEAIRDILHRQVSKRPAALTSRR